jgi:hypothetical protein
LTNAARHRPPRRKARFFSSDGPTPARVENHLEGFRPRRERRLFRCRRQPVLHGGRS